MRVSAGLWITALSVVLFASQEAQAFSYGDFIGTNVDFLDVNDVTTSPGDPDGLFGGAIGAPILQGDSLIFFPTQFFASAQGGSSDLTSATLNATVDAKGNMFITNILIEEFGDVDLSGVGTAATNASVTVNGTVTVLEANFQVIAPQIIQFTLDFDPKDSFELPGDQGFQLFSGSGMIDVESVVPFATKAVVSFDNIMDANSEAGTTALIQKKVVSGPLIAVSIIPEPATGALLAAGLVAVALTGRRRR